MDNLVPDTVEVHLEIPVPPREVEVTVTESESPVRSSPILSRLLRMADTYRRSGAPKQALEMYFELVEKHPESFEGREASGRLMEISEEYEVLGQLRQARSIYERLLGDGGNA
jgi:hypothetical protein